MQLRTRCNRDGFYREPDAQSEAKDDPDWTPDSSSEDENPSKRSKRSKISGGSGRRKCVFYTLGLATVCGAIASLYYDYLLFTGEEKERDFYLNQTLPLA